MGEIEGVKGAWGYPEGGMGAVSEAIAKSAKEAGVDIFVNSQVSTLQKYVLVPCATEKAPRHSA
jgi:hypothetical protein